MLPLIHNTTDLAQAMFASAQIVDNRRTQRLVDIASRFADNTGRSAAYACDGQGSLVEGTYRFILWIQKTTGLPVDECLWRRYDG